MGPNKNPKNPEGFQQNPKKFKDKTLTPKKSHAKFLSLKNLQKGKQVWLNFNLRTVRPGYTDTTTNLQIVLNSQEIPT